jgi:uncharacterized membrane protein
MRRPGWQGLALLLGGSGVLHLVRPRIYEPLIPRSLGDARTWVLGSGVAEIACAAGLSIRVVRRPAALASAALLVAVFPGNIHQARLALRSSRTSTGYRAGTVARLPLQAPLVLWALRLAREAGRS